MPVGKCGLCLKSCELQRSHLLPSALYRMTRDPNLKNPNPVLITREITRTSSEQTRDYFLCAECEERFNTQGERYAMSQVRDGEIFPLLEHISALAPSHVVPPGATSPEFSLYFEVDTPKIDRDRLVYYCLSIIWRSAAHSWKGINSLDLGPYQESVRRYLLRQTAFPGYVVVHFFVARDELSQQTLFPPSILKRLGPFRSYSFTSRGLLYWMHVGKEIPSGFYSFCFVNSPLRPIISCNCEKKTMEAFVQMSATSRVARALQGPR